MSETWKYYTTILTASLSMDIGTALTGLGVDPKNLNAFAPETLMPQLNRIGQQGWELVHMQPVVVGGKQDIAGFPGVNTAGREWTHSYFCVFKHRVETP